MVNTRRELGAARIRALAVRAHVDPRTLERAYRAAHGEGTPPRGDAGDRALAALRAEGLLPTPAASEQSR